MNPGTAIVSFCETFSRDHGFPPTMREIQLGCGLSSTSVVFYHLRKLRAAGAVDYWPGSSRTIRVLGGTH